MASNTSALWSTNVLSGKDIFQTEVRKPILSSNEVSLGYRGPGSVHLSAMEACAHSRADTMNRYVNCYVLKTELLQKQAWGLNRGSMHVRTLFTSEKWFQHLVSRIIQNQFQVQYLPNQPNTVWIRCFLWKSENIHLATCHRKANSSN